jgi:hypothetical protein
MKAVLVQPKNQREMDFISQLLNKLGVSSHLMTEEEIEDLGLSMMMKNADRSKKVSRESVMRKLRSK